MNPLLKFVIGFVAGICTAFLPRLTAALSVAAEGTSLIFFNTTYLVISLSFAVIIGAVITILEWDVARKPRDIFMTALGIPALITGAINTATVTTQLDKANHDKDKLIEELSKQGDIPITSSGPDRHSNSSQPPQDLPGLSLLDSSTAYAADRDDKLGKRFVLFQQFQIQKEEPLYYIVLYESPNEEGAKEKAKEIMNIIPNIRIVQTGNGYLVIQGGGPREKSDALLEALQLKKLRSDLKPSLLSEDQIRP